MRLYFLLMNVLTLCACSARPPADGSTKRELQEQTALKRANIYQLIKATQGDHACYVELKAHPTHELKTFSSRFEWCEEDKLETGKLYKFSFEELKVADCDSIEPCGSTKRVMGVKSAQELKNTI